MKPNLNELLKVFLGLDIEFVIIGGFAAALHGSSMVTRDLDLCFLLTPQNIDKLRSSLRDLNPKLRINPEKLSFLTHPETNQGFKNLYLETDLGIVDIVSIVTGVGEFSVVAADAEVIELFGYRVKIMSTQHLIASKKALGRPKDILVVQEIEEILKKRS
jgi:predicted nucleotidyltransferase